MTVDSCFAALLADPRNEVRPPPPHVPMAKVRRAANAAMIAAAGPELHAVRDLTLPLASRDLGARLYRPSPLDALPVLLFLHGGGWVWGDLDTHDAVCREISRRAGCAVVSLDYRLAPETPFPGPADDAFEALLALVRLAPSLGLDPARMALGGDSAGANLAISAALRARTAGPPLRRLALLYPALDPSCDSGSQREFAEGFLLTRSAMRWFWRCYLGGDDIARDPSFAPLAGDLAGLPPTAIATAEYDILRDEGEALAERLAKAGVGVRLRRYPGMIHGFVLFSGLTPVAADCLSDFANDLKAAFGE